MNPTPTALMLVPRVVERLADLPEVANAPLDDSQALVLLETAQRERIADRCPFCNVLQSERWQCACCSARGHFIPRSKTMPNYCSWCVAEGCAQHHAQLRRTG